MSSSAEVHVAQPEQVDEKILIGDKIFTDEDFDAYYRSPGSIIRKIWICVQVVVMIQFMVRGLINYNRALGMFTKV